MTFITVDKGKHRTTKLTLNVGHLKCYNRTRKKWKAPSTESTFSRLLMKAVCCSDIILWPGKHTISCEE
ncbi:hypothetical protein GDO81_005296 [Engystomops pustulosus]|uniref:Uncharacterized protein n=1 Tax=Engystomops pustulosus TaxID=76066 RepID=A0AAV7CME3_ENGPU|nr:hypothetical protein GDO81_005296 [Engystomops pustulosus]